MSKIQSKQIQKILTGPIKITGVAVASTNSSVVVTTPITNALTIAGDNGTSVPLIVSSSSVVPGVITSSPMNRTDIWLNLNKTKIESATGKEVYGKLTNVSSVYTLSFYYLDNAGAEQPYTFTSNTTIDFDFNYRYEFHQAPADIIVAQLSRNVSQDAGGAGAVMKYEVLNVTALNTITSLSAAPTSPTAVKLFVNGKLEDPLGGAPAFTISASVNVNWNSVNAGYSVDTTDRVIAEYPI